MKLSNKYDFTVFRFNPYFSVLTNKHWVKIGIVVYVLMFFLNDFRIIFNNACNGENDRVSVGIGNIAFDQGGFFGEAWFCNITPDENNHYN